jgi:hypothetical protein
MQLVQLQLSYSLTNSAGLGKNFPEFAHELLDALLSLRL